MKDIENAYTEDRSLRAATIVYAVVMLGVFFIGLYGLFSLFWLATSTIERSLHALG
jgi:hypothetical protein